MQVLHVYILHHDDPQDVPKTFSHEAPFHFEFKFFTSTCCPFVFKFLSSGGTSPRLIYSINSLLSSTLRSSPSPTVNPFE